MEKLFDRSAHVRWPTKQTINFNEQSERFRFLHFGGPLLTEDKGSFVGPNLTKGPIGPVHFSARRGLRETSSSSLHGAFTYGIPRFAERNNDNNDNNNISFVSRRG